MNKDMVNRRNTREWVKCNEDTNASHWRDEFVKEHGGNFDKEGIKWVWKEKVQDIRIKQERKEFTFINNDGVEFLTDNFTKFCRKNDLNKSAMYKVMSGERTHHKGFTCKKLPPKGE
tara:strand:- start:329 stop:679 length:351 start_codon:yes stop_codon:yes gene_type:complete